MKKMACFLAVALIVTGLSGCPLVGGVAKVDGAWLWIQPRVPADPDATDDFTDETVNENFQNIMRLRKTVTFGPLERQVGTFKYLEEAFLPDRMPNTANDLGAGVIWEWREIYSAEGTYRTDKYEGENMLFDIPGLNTELNAAITKWRQMYIEVRLDSEGNPRTDSENRPFFEFLYLDDSSDANNPLYLRALMGMNPFDELMISWNGNWSKSLSFNDSISGGVETYARID